MQLVTGTHAKYLEEYWRDLELNGNEPEYDDTNYEELDFEKIDPDEPWIIPEQFKEEAPEDESMEEEKELTEVE